MKPQCLSVPIWITVFVSATFRIDGFAFQDRRPPLFRNKKEGSAMSTQNYNRLQSHKVHPRITFTRLNDLSEWRDIMFDPPSTLDGLVREDYQQGPLREICILPFPLDDVILQGETKELCLYEERFHQLFQKSMNDHGGVVAMGLLDPPANILQTMPLCEIESYQTIEGDTGFGTRYSILATIRVVGRCSLIYIEENGERNFLTGWCTEVCDDVMNVDGRTSGGRDIIQLGNDLADRLEAVFKSIIRLENELEDVKDYDEDILEKIILHSELDVDDEEEEDGEDEFDDDSLKARFERALQSAKSYDTQGYKISSNAAESKSGNMIRSLQELTGLSWAYFSNDLWSTEMLHFRLKALEVDELCERMKVALVMMMEHRSKLKQTLKNIRGSSEDKF